ncbi:MAG: NAD(P)/FAD-dependent oxidoreductase [Ruminococcaceae bacterium]|nr:NAD(P)/FAD-dependent oxidoreductase [Oscillospiraceae bacterium]
MSRVLVIGGGAAGLLAAGTAAQWGAEVTVLERNPRLARKVMITGKGRCNVTNASDLQQLIAHVPRNGRFLYSAFSNFTSEDIRELLSQYGVETKVERGNRVFPVSDKAVDVVDALVRFVHANGVRVRQARVTDLILDNGVCGGVIDEDGTRYEADAVIVCTGGLSYPRTGSTGDGYHLAKQAGHTVTTLLPSLVPLCTREYDVTQMQGLSLKNCTLRVTDTVTGKTVFEELGEMMFTHFGVTGPLVLSASAHMKDMAVGRYILSIDLKPALSEQQLSDRLLRELEAHKHATVATMLATLLPRSMVKVMADRSGLQASAPCHSVTREQRLRLLEKLKNFTLTVEAFRPIDEAVITSGGVEVKEVDAKTMASRLVDGLYFAGEVLDVDAYTGGYNLQIAFSTGAAAGRAAAQR